MSIKKPPSHLLTPQYVTLGKGKTIHRVHQTRYAASSFNPCAGQPTRFVPIKDSAGNCVPSLYTGSTVRAAIHETIFHDIPAKATVKTVLLQNVLIRSHAALQTMRFLKLVELRNVNLNAWKITRRELIESSPKLYSQTAEWAKTIHQAFPDAEGLIWTSNQCDPDDAYLFFGDRVAANDFSLVYSRDGATEKSFLKDVRDEGKLRGITITV